MSVLNSGPFLPSYCNPGVGFSCIDYVYTEDWARFKLNNRLGQDAEYFRIEMESEMIWGLLHPSLGKNYQIPATKVVDGMTTKAGVALPSPPVPTGGGSIPGILPFIIFSIIARCSGGIFSSCFIMASSCLLISSTPFLSIV